MPTSEPTDIKLAIYTERLDRYIETQEILNKSLVSSYQSIQTDVAEIQDWRSKIYGVKTGLVAVGFLTLHLVIIIGALTGINWNNK